MNCCYLLEVTYCERHDGLSQLHGFPLPLLDFSLRVSLHLTELRLSGSTEIQQCEYCYL